MGAAETGDHEDAFAACWWTEMPSLLRYAQRHVGADEALDVTAEVFAVAWRRWAEVPTPARPWLIGVARRVVANSRRTTRRRQRLRSRLELLHDVTEESVYAVDLVEQLEALRRLAGLSDPDREALLLVAWDGLSSTEAAQVLGLSAATFRKRLSRARAALHLDHADAPTTPRPLTWETS